MKQVTIKAGHSQISTAAPHSKQQVLRVVQVPKDYTPELPVNVCACG